MRYTAWTGIDDCPVKFCSAANDIEQYNTPKRDSVKEFLIVRIGTQTIEDLAVVADDRLESPLSFRVAVTSIVIDVDIVSSIRQLGKIVQQLVRQHGVALGD